MVVPTRRHNMISNRKRSKWANDHKKIESKEEKIISEEEHKKRLIILKQIGILKEDE